MMTLSSLEKNLRQYTSSYYLSEGLRLTLGIMVPVLTGYYTGYLNFGVSAALGALAIGIIDHAGPIHHRINGMVAGIFFITIVTVVTRLSIPFPFVFAGWLIIAAFFFSIIGVYGHRAAQLGTAALLLLTIFSDRGQASMPWWQQGILVAGGGLFYFLLSLALYRIKPYKLAQQALGQCIIATADYMRIKAAFYGSNPDYEALYNSLSAEQVKVNNEQQAVREIIFKTRSIVQESTHTGRVLVMTFLDLVDLFENILSSQPDYRLLHDGLRKTSMMEAVQSCILQLAEDLEQTGLSFQQGKMAIPGLATDNNLDELLEQFDQARSSGLNSGTPQAFIGLRNVLDSLRNIHNKLERLHLYSSYDNTLRLQRSIDYQRFVVPSYLSPKLLRNNLSWNANIFRYSVRMVVALLVGYGLSLLLPLGHSYWLLLTIAVILKPAYAITRKRNIDRLSGTLVGVVAGAAILYSVQDDQLLLGLLILSMILSFSFWRHKYFLSVAFLTVFVLIAFTLLRPGDFSPLLQDRMLDTLLGSAIAGLMTLVIPPLWEKKQLHFLAAETLNAIRKYFEYTSRGFLGKQFVLSDYKWNRKNAFVNLSNLNDAFQRMLSEPKSQQHMASYWHQWVVSAQLLLSNIAALSPLREQLTIEILSQDFKTPVTAISNNLFIASEVLLGKKPMTEHHNQSTGASMELLKKEASILMQLRSEELERGDMETGTRAKLIWYKSIVDQFEIIGTISEETLKISTHLSSQK